MSNWATLSSIGLFFSVLDAGKWKDRAVKVLQDAGVIDDGENASWDRALNIAGAWPSFTDSNLPAAWWVLESQVIEGRKENRILKAGVAAVVAACRLLDAYIFLAEANDRNNRENLWRALYSIQRNATVMVIAHKASSIGRKASKVKNEEDGRSAKGVAMYVENRSQWGSAAKAAEEIAPKVGLAVEVLVKHLRQYNKANKPDSALQSADSAIKDRFS